MSSSLASFQKRFQILDLEVYRDHIKLFLEVHESKCWSEQHSRFSEFCNEAINNLGQAKPPPDTDPDIVRMCRAHDAILRENLKKFVEMLIRYPEYGHASFNDAATKLLKAIDEEIEVLQ